MKIESVAVKILIKKRPFNSCFPMNGLKVLRTGFYILLINSAKTAAVHSCFCKVLRNSYEKTSGRQNCVKLCEVFQNSFFEEQLLFPKIVFKKLV